ncbi:hypothetical protein [Helicobacter monodelphidis]|uniref:hypothetical protein n=1 Tax=Helicobacter sp. 15-1451 TaxID=2004995 RepID=UPI0011BDE7F5|nr:hypothetical protein [Helicobacter sp. 15-1451]
MTDLSTALKVFDQELDLSYRKRGVDNTHHLERITFPTLKQVEDFHYAKKAAQAASELGHKTDTQELQRSAFSGFPTPFWKLNQNFAVRGTLENPWMGDHEARQTLGTGSEFRQQKLSAMISQLEQSHWVSPALAQEFTSLTGLDYSEKNVQFVKEGMNGKDAESFLKGLKDTSVVVGMQIDKKGENITLIFGSGEEREIKLGDLYSGTGDFITDKEGNRSSSNQEVKKMTNEELNNLDFSKVGAIFDETNKVVSLKDWGIVAIEKLTYGDGSFLSFGLRHEDGSMFYVQELFNMNFHINSKKESQQNWNSKPSVFPFNPKVDVRI